MQNNKSKILRIRINLYLRLIFKDVRLTNQHKFSVAAFAPSSPILFRLKNINEFKQILRIRINLYCRLIFNEVKLTNLLKF